MSMDRDEIRKACEAATPGPWTFEVRDGDEWWFGNGQEAVVRSTAPMNFVAVMHGEDDEDAAFIAGAREWVPALLDENEKLERFKRLLALVYDDYTGRLDKPAQQILDGLMITYRALLAEGE